MPATIDPNAVYTSETLAQVFGVDVTTLHRWEKQGDLPPGYQLGGRRRWLGSAVLDDQRRRQAKAMKEAGLAHVA